MKISLLLPIILTAGALHTHAQSSNTYDTKSLPEPFATKSVMNFSKVQGWDEGNKPIAPQGFKVTKYADGFENPRWMYELPNGDVLVAESNKNLNAVMKAGGAVIGAGGANNLRNSADRISILRDTDKDGMPDMRDTFLTGLNQPFGMLLLGDWLYVANTNALMRFPYKQGQTSITAKGEKLADLPEGKKNQHWTRNIIASPDGKKIYIAVGSSGNIAEDGMDAELLRAAILEVNPDGSGLEVYASGLRNPVGMDFVPGTNQLWTAVNERDGLGDDLVPDYLTAVKKGGFYGWPYCYAGKIEDPRVKEKSPEMVKKALKPDVDLGAHTASLGLAFYDKKNFPAKYHNGAFIAQHGSWNRSKLSGYKVVFVPFANGKPTGKPEDFLTGFIADIEKDKVYGRPTGVVVLHTGALLLTDDITNTIWHISYDK